MEQSQECKIKVIFCCIYELGWTNEENESAMDPGPQWTTPSVAIGDFKLLPLPIYSSKSVAWKIVVTISKKETSL